MVSKKFSLSYVAHICQFHLFLSLNLLSEESKSKSCWMWARPGRKTRMAPSTTANCGDFSCKNPEIRIFNSTQAYQHQNKTSINTPTLAWGVCCTYVVDEVNQQVHVDLIRVHVLQHLPSPAAEVVQFWTKVPAGGGVPHNHLLEQTQDSYTHTLSCFL